MKKQTLPILAFCLILFSLAHSTFAAPENSQKSNSDHLVGAWHGKVQFSNGVLSEVNDLEFMYVFNQGGTMTESSNHDSAPPVPPAYGIWRKTKARQYEAKYSFFWTNPPKGFDDIANGRGWSHGGSGVIIEKIQLSEDGNGFTSTMSLDILDTTGKIIETGNLGKAEAKRIRF